MNDQIIRAREVLDPSWVDDYERIRDILHRQILDLNTNIFIHNKMAEFPRTLFLPQPNNNILWRTVDHAIAEQSILIATRAIVGDGKSLTLQRYQKEVLAHIVDSNAKVEIEARLSKVNFDQRVDPVRKKLVRVRDKFIAHLDYKVQLSNAKGTSKTAGPTVGDMQTVIDAAIDLFAVLGFDTTYYPWWGEYNDTTRNRKETDVERLLERIARESYLLNLPERDPEVWQHRHAKLSKKDIEILNQYRVRFGLPTI